MSLVENLRLKPGPRPLQPLQAPEVQRRLQDAEARLAALESQHGVIALDAIGGDAAATDRLNDLARDLAGARDGVATMRAAHKAALDRDEATIAAQRAALHKTQLNALRKHLEAKDAAAVAMCEAIAEAVGHYKTVQERSAKAIAACPIGTEFPDGSLCAPGEIHRRVGAELFRVSGDGDAMGGHPNAFPGSMCPDLDAAAQPESIVPLVEQMKRDSAYVLAKLTGKAA